MARAELPATPWRSAMPLPADPNDVTDEQLKRIFAGDWNAWGDVIERVMEKGALPHTSEDIPEIYEGAASGE